MLRRLPFRRAARGLTGDAFIGATAPDLSAAIYYDFDGDGQADTRFVFRQAAGE